MSRRKRDFADEKRALQLLTQGVDDLSTLIGDSESGVIRDSETAVLDDSEQVANGGGKQAAFTSFYQNANKEMQKKRQPASVGYRNVAMGSYQGLPICPNMHIRGYCEIMFDRQAYIYYDTYVEVQRMRDVTRMKGRRVHLRTFHSQPTTKPDSDIPTNADIFDFIKYGHREHVVIGQKYISILTKTYAVLEKSLKLWQWESENAYKVHRIRQRREKRNCTISQREQYERYARIGLRGIGLHWPTRKYQKRKVWQEKLTQSLGIHVEQLDVGKRNPAPTTRSEFVLAILSGRRTPSKAAKEFTDTQGWYVTTSDVNRWVESFIAAGKACLDPLSDEE